MSEPVLRVFSYLPNPRVWKAQIAAEICGVTIEVIGDEPARLPGWLWDFDARELRDDEKDAENATARESKRGFAGTLHKTDAFLEAHPYGTVPAAFSPDGSIGIFESNSILRAVARADESDSGLYGRKAYDASRIDSFLDATLVFGREAQVYLLALRDMNRDLHDRMRGAYEFYLDGIERALASSRYIAGDSLTLADISFVCDFGQFLTERRARKRLAEVDLAPISDCEPQTHPRSLDHLLTLGARPEFARHIGDYLDPVRSDFASPPTIA